MKASDFSAMKTRLTVLRVKEQQLEKDMQEAKAVIDGAFGDVETATVKLDARRKDLEARLLKFTKKLKEVEDAINALT